MRTRYQLGISLIEVLVVISILVLLTSIAFPAFQNVKWSVKKSRSMSQMRQIHAAVMLYTNDYGGPAGPNLGLPPVLYIVKQAQSLPDELFWTGGVPQIPPHPAVYTWMPVFPDPRFEPLIAPWKEHVANTERNPVILLDATFNRESGRFVGKSAFGIYYDGHIEHRKARGDLTQYSLWE